MPASILEIAKWWRDFTPTDPTSSMAGNLAAINPRPKKIPTTPDAGRKLAEFHRYCDEQAIANADKDPFTAALWTRVYEASGRLALVYACSKNHTNPELDIEAVTWASRFALWTTEQMVRMMTQNVADTHYQALSQRVTNLIRRRGGTITRAELVRNAHLSSKQLQEILETLLEGDTIGMRLRTEGRKPTTEYFLQQSAQDS